MSIKPILFNTDMVRAILDGRKTVTRRIIKPQPEMALAYIMAGHNHSKWNYSVFEEEEYKKHRGKEQYWTPPCNGDDILYVRETWNHNPLNEYGNEPDKYIHKATYDGHGGEVGWRPSIHMPKEAARIWLKVTNVRVERLRNITTEQAQSEGTEYACNEKCRSYPWCDSDVVLKGGCECFNKLWNTTIKKSDIVRYGWEANPWVWVIEFERCEKPEEESQ
jgi:hypothetical protein